MSGSSSGLRTVILVGILALLLGALWYDYKVARPAVDRAFETIEKLNNDVNTKAGQKYLTEKDVQAALHRAPSDSFQEGNYQVERYSWRSGLPIKTHDYFAVYSAGVPLIFLTHYKYGLPREELMVKEPPPGSGDPAPPEAGTMPGDPVPAPTETKNDPAAAEEKKSESAPAPESQPAPAGDAAEKSATEKSAPPAAPEKPAAPGA